MTEPAIQMETIDFSMSDVRTNSYPYWKNLKLDTYPILCKDVSVKGKTIIFLVFMFRRVYLWPNELLSQ